MQLLVGMLTVVILIDTNAKLEITDNWKNNALMKSLTEDVHPDATCALLFIRAGCPVNKVNHAGDSQMSLPVPDDNSNVINELIKVQM